MRRMSTAGAIFLLGIATAIFFAPMIRAQASTEEIPIQRCDVLPVVVVQAAGAEMRFLVDTGATSILNLKSFPVGKSKTIRVDSWRGSAATSAREVTLPEIQLGKHKLLHVKLPAIDLSPIGKACGGQIDGILGVDLLDQMGVTIDLKRAVAVLNLAPADTKALYADMEKTMHPCEDAFNGGRADVLEDCFDPEIVLYTPDGEFRGRKQVMRYLNERYLKFAPGIEYKMSPQDVQSFGDALWYSYDYSIDANGQHIAGHGMAMCRREGGRWRILNMHNSLVNTPPAKP